MRHVIVATGVGRRTYKTSIAVIRLGVRKTGTSASDVHRKALSASSSLVKYLKAKKVSKLQTTSLSLFATYDYRSRVRRVAGYTGSTMLSFEVPIEKAGPLLDGSIRNGATSVSSVSFKAENAISADARRFAIHDAVVRAREEANVAVLSLGRVMGSPVHIKITDTFYAQPIAAPQIQRVFSAAPGRPAPPPPSTPIVSSEQTVRAFVTVTFATY